MIEGIGIDLIELDRIERVLAKQKRFLKRILTSTEREVYTRLSKETRQVEYVAGRFAAKEAFAKAVGTGIGKLSFQHIEVISNENGAPQIYVQGYEAKRILLSISHSKQYAIAQVIITSG